MSSLTIAVLAALASIVLGASICYLTVRPRFTLLQDEILAIQQYQEWEEVEHQKQLQSERRQTRTQVQQLEDILNTERRLKDMEERTSPRVKETYQMRQENATMRRKYIQLQELYRLEVDEKERLRTHVENLEHEQKTKVKEAVDAEILKLLRDPTLTVARDTRLAAAEKKNQELKKHLENRIREGITNGLTDQLGPLEDKFARECYQHDKTKAALECERHVGKVAAEEINRLRAIIPTLQAEEAKVVLLEGLANNFLEILRLHVQSAAPMSPRDYQILGEKVAQAANNFSGSWKNAGYVFNSNYCLPLHALGRCLHNHPGQQLLAASVQRPNSSQSNLSQPIITGSNTTSTQQATVAFLQPTISAATAPNTPSNASVPTKEDIIKLIHDREANRLGSCPLTVLAQYLTPAWTNQQKAQYEELILSIAKDVGNRQYKLQDGVWLKHSLSIDVPAGQSTSSNTSNPMAPRATQSLLGNTVAPPAASLGLSNPFAAAPTLSPSATADSSTVSSPAKTNFAVPAATQPVPSNPFATAPVLSQNTISTTPAGSPVTANPFGFARTSNTPSLATVRIPTAPQVLTTSNLNPFVSNFTVSNTIPWKHVVELKIKAHLKVKGFTSVSRTEIVNQFVRDCPGAVGEGRRQNMEALFDELFVKNSGSAFYQLRKP